MDVLFTRKVRTSGSSATCAKRKHAPRRQYRLEHATAFKHDGRHSRPVPKLHPGAGVAVIIHVVHTPAHPTPLLEESIHKWVVAEQVLFELKDE